METVPVANTRHRQELVPQASKMTTVKTSAKHETSNNGMSRQERNDEITNGPLKQ